MAAEPRPQGAAFFNQPSVGHDTTFVVDIDRSDAYSNGALDAVLQAWFTAHPTHCRHIRVTNDKRLTEIPSNFLCNTAWMDSVDLTAVAGVTKIGGLFLAYCPSLHFVDLSPLSDIREIPECFLGWSGIKQLDLSPLRNVATVGSQFLAACPLQALDLTPFANVTEITRGFLQGTGVVFLDFSHMRHVTTIGDDFLYGANSLHTVDLSAFTRVDTIGDIFLRCDKLAFVVVPDQHANQVLDRRCGAGSAGASVRGNSQWQVVRRANTAA